MLVDRKREREELDRLLAMPSAQLVAVSGRRRLGKTTLLRHWAQQSGHSISIVLQRQALPKLQDVMQRSIPSACTHSLGLRMTCAMQDDSAH